MTVTVLFHSYFKDLTGCSSVQEEVSEGAALGPLLERVRQRFPKLQPLARSTLVAVDVDYQGPEYLLKEGDEISLFPPVQGG